MATRRTAKRKQPFEVALISPAEASSLMRRPYEDMKIYEVFFSVYFFKYEVTKRETQKMRGSRTPPEKKEGSLVP